MNKKIILVLIIFFIAIIFLIIKFGGSSKDNNFKTLELAYKTNGGVPYEWQYEIENKDIVEFVKSYQVDNQNKNGLVGAPITINYVFKGLKEGTTTITFKYVNITNGEVDREEKNIVKVDNGKNISLVVEK